MTSKRLRALETPKNLGRLKQLRLYDKDGILYARGPMVGSPSLDPSEISLEEARKNTTFYTAILGMVSGTNGTEETYKYFWMNWRNGKQA